MKSYKLQYVRLTSRDGDMPFLVEIHKLPEISKYISIDTHNYFNYVTNTDDVYYFKVIFNNLIVATAHIEKNASALYVSILTLPKYQNNGFAAQILADIKSRQLVQDFSEIIVFIDKSNIPSIRLFEKSGFIKTREEDELLEYRLSV